MGNSGSTQIAHSIQQQPGAVPNSQNQSGLSSSVISTSLQPLAGNQSTTLLSETPQQLSTNDVVDGVSLSMEDQNYEGERRPLMDREEEALRHRTGNNATQLSRRASTMSRLGSRLLPDNVMRNLLSSGEETAEEGQALRHGSLARPRSTLWSGESQFGSARLASISSRRRSTLRSDERRRTIRGPFPLSLSEHQPLPETDLTHSFPDSSTPNQSSLTATQPRSRLLRVRESVSASIPNIFGRFHSRRRLERTPPPRPSRAAFMDDSDHLLTSNSPLITDHNRQSTEAPHELDAVEAETTHSGPSSRITTGMSTIRRIPAGLRSRSTRLIRRGEHPPHSQVLQLAATAIAAQLSGQANPSTSGLSSLGNDTFDGSIQNFVQTLQDAASAQAGADVDFNSTNGELPPVNFMRVFQFPNDENGSPITSQGRSRDVDSMDIDTFAATGEGERSVTLVLVGVRSMPHPTETGGSGTFGPSLDALLSLPFLPPANLLRNGSSGALFRRTDTRTRSSQRRHSTTGYSFPTSYENQRHATGRTVPERGSAAQGDTTPPHSGMHVTAFESPPGPHPPPSTPADIRSGYTTPIRRPSSASGVVGHAMPDVQESLESGSSVNLNDTSFTTARQRRRSDSEFARRPELGSGAARRNGVVEPDHPPAGRSWLIYVVGTNVSPDHPAFSMPSLFTDNPTYEDMQMLSTLLGPVKPPVATQEQVNSAGGIYRLVAEGSTLVAHAVRSLGTSVAIIPGDRCLVCLCEYEVGDELRQLSKCQHTYHRECIDQWLTTGRNSCPLCRSQGVNGESPATTA